MRPIKSIINYHYSYNNPEERRAQQSNGSEYDYYSHLLWTRQGGFSCRQGQGKTGIFGCKSNGKLVS